MFDKLVQDANYEIKQSLAWLQPAAFGTVLSADLEWFS